MSLPTKLVTLRKEKGLTQMELAERMHVSRQAVSRWEVGAAVPSIDNLRVLSNLYGIPIGYLLDETANNINEESGVQEQTNNESITQVNKKKYSITYLILIALLLIATVVVSYLILSRPGKEEPVPISQMDEDFDFDSSAGTFMFE